LLAIFQVGSFTERLDLGKSSARFSPHLATGQVRCVGSRITVSRRPLHPWNSRSPFGTLRKTRR